MAFMVSRDTAASRGKYHSVDCIASVLLDDS
jgi:hypothetical protein